MWQVVRDVTVSTHVMHSLGAYAVTLLQPLPGWALVTDSGKADFLRCGWRACVNFT